MCPVMIITIYFAADHKKMVSGQKNSIFGPQKDHFGQLGPWNGLLSGQTATYQKTKGIPQDMEELSSHWVGTVRAKERWFHRCSVKKRRIWVKNELFWPKIHFFFKFSNFVCHHHDRTPKRQHFCVDSVAWLFTKKWFRAKKQLFWTSKTTFWFLMMIMMVSMIIMMIILVILIIIMTKMTKKHTITVKFE